MYAGQLPFASPDLSTLCSPCSGPQEADCKAFGITVDLAKVTMANCAPRARRWSLSSSHTASPRGFLFLQVQIAAPSTCPFSLWVA